MHKTKWTRNILGYATILLLGVCSLSARNLSVSEALALAQKNSSTLKTAELTLQSSVNEAGVNSFLPSIDISASAQEMTGNLLEGQSFMPLTLNFSPTVTWSFSSSYFNTKKTSDLNLEGAYLTYASTLSALNSSTESSYWSLAVAHKAVENAEESLRTAEESLKKTETLYENSRTSSLSVLQAKLNLSDAELSLDSARETYEAKRTSFLDVLGLDHSEELVLDEVPEVLDLDYTKLQSVVDSYIGNTTTVQSAELKVRQKEQSEKTTRDNATIPTLSVSTNLGYTLNQDLVQNLKFSATAKVSIPVNSFIPNSSAYVNVKNASLATKKEEISAEATRKNLENKLSTSISSIETSLKKRENLNLHLELAEENLAQVTEAFEAGYSSQSALTDAQKSVESAKTSILNNRNSILTDLVTISGLLEIDLNTLLEALK